MILTLIFVKSLDGSKSSISTSVNMAVAKLNRAPNNPSVTMIDNLLRICLFTF